MARRSSASPVSDPGRPSQGLGRARSGTRAAARSRHESVAARRGVRAWSAQRTGDGSGLLLRAPLVALTTLLVGVAAAVAYAVSRDANKDVAFVGERVAGHGSRALGTDRQSTVPVRTMDEEVGALTVAFNALVDRFAAAQSSYKSDLARVGAADRRPRRVSRSGQSHELLQSAQRDPWVRWTSS